MTMVSENVEEKEATATKDITTVPMGLEAPLAARTEAARRISILARYTKKVGAEDTACLCMVSPWAAWFTFLFCSSTRSSCLFPKPNIWISLIPYTLSSTRDFISPSLVL